MTAPYYSDDLVTLYHGDCMDLLPQVSGVDAVITSPPYNLAASVSQGRHAKGRWRSHDGHPAIAYDSHGDDLPPAKYAEWQRDVLTACWATLSDKGAIFYNHKPRHQNAQLWLPTEVNPGLPLRQIVIWARTGGMNFAPTHYMSTHEWICVFAKPKWRLKNRGASGVGDVWRIGPDQGNAHPAPFPLGLPNRIIETAAPKLVCDPFAGSGTTLFAAKSAGVRAVGVELSERYCEMTAKRLSQDALPFEVAG